MIFRRNEFQLIVVSSYRMISMICSRELLFFTGAGTVSRFVPENEQGQSDINTVSSTHVETVCLLINQNAKAKHHVNVGIDAEDYYKIKEGK